MKYYCSHVFENCLSSIYMLPPTIAIDWLRWLFVTPMQTKITCKNLSGIGF